MKRRSPPPERVYSRLLRAFGRQGWWPVTPAGVLRPRYRPGFAGTLTERERAEICVGAILTQNTAWTNVERALEALHRAGARGLAPLARMPRSRLARLIRSSGYFRQKAKKLQLFARHALSRGRLSRWLSGELPALRDELLSLWGVGPETADSILLYAGGRPTFVIDAYTLRVGKRLGWFGRADYDSAQRLLEDALPRDAALYQEFHALLVALAKRHCRTRPLCVGCPVNGDCPAAARAPRRAR